jgi:uncharacterized protein YutD
LEVAIETESYAYIVLEYCNMGNLRSVLKELAKEQQKVSEDVYPSIL